MTAARYSWTEKLLLAAEALVALAHARLILHRTRPDDVIARNTATRRRMGTVAAECDGPCAQVAFIIPRIAKRLPWRADCLVQALAGQAMLQRRKIAGTIAIGTTKHPDGRFEAHAWLSCGEAIIIGGDIARFEPLLDPSVGPEAPQ